MSTLTQKLSDILRCGLKPGYTSVSYAISRGGKLLAADSLGTIGDKAGTPADCGSTYNIGSVSKIFCAVAVMQLAEQGKVDLDIPVYKYLPRLWMPDERYKQITLRHCLSHSSGLPGTQWKGFALAGTDPYDYYADVYDYLSKVRLKADPGTYSVYCNDGFTMAEMVVSEVSGQPFEQYSVEHITDPIGAESTRLVPLYHPDHPMVVEKGWPPEIMYIRACGGYTSSMTDLCRFGEQFLRESAILSDDSKAEMGRHQGVTFLKKDQRGNNFGLGWDSMAFTYPGYDLGEHVLMKGGKTLEFGTKLVIIPKYDAVLAISQTDDCGLDCMEAILRLFSVAMWETEGVNVLTDGVPVPDALAKELSGVYMMQTNILKLSVYGAFCSISTMDHQGNLYPLYKPYRYTGDRFTADDGTVLDFERDGDDLYALRTVEGLLVPLAQKALPAAPLSGVWRSRMGKRYLVADMGPRDVLAGQMAGAVTFVPMPEVEGLMLVRTIGRMGLGLENMTECAVRPLNDSQAVGVTRMPTNPGRDHLTPLFEQRDGAEYVSVLSYTFRDVDSLPVYEGQNFAEASLTYRLASPLSALPAVPAGRRALVMNDALICVYDSLEGKPFAPVLSGYLLLV